MPSKAMKLVEKTSARVFCQAGVGGNPVTIFGATEALSRPTQVRLAQTCTWESVMVDRSENRLSFYTPNGRPIAFCAHAAMGGATALSKQYETPLSFSIDREDRHQSCTAVVHAGDIVALDIQDTFSLQKVRHPPVLLRILRETFGLQGTDLTEVEAPSLQLRYPTFCTASVFGRPKTVVYVNAVDRLQSLRAPPVGSAFVAACDAIESTGIYLYTRVADGYECRQFPRCSGYPEDPATGVAAAALACALHQAGYPGDVVPHRFLQGTAMQRPSVLLVDDVQMNETPSSETDEHSVRFRLIGQVTVDERETIEVEDNGVFSA